MQTTPTDKVELIFKDDTSSEGVFKCGAIELEFDYISFDSGYYKLYTDTGRKDVRLKYRLKKVIKI